MKKYIHILRKCPLFYHIQDDQIIHLLGCLKAKVETFDKKNTIIAEGSPAKQIGILLSGSAQITQIDYYGNKSILGNIGPSQLFAEAFACAEVPSVPVDVIANEACEVILIDCSYFLRMCSNNCGFHQQLIFNLMKNLAAKTIMINQKLEITSKRSTREKLMTFLMLQAKKKKSNSFDIPFDRQELADYLEVDRSGLSAEISKLRKEGILNSHKKHFELL